MGKYFKYMIVSVLLSNLLMADVVFDLGAQQFSNSVEGNYEDSTYDVGVAIVSTSMAYVEGAYLPKATSTGNFSVQIKDPKPQWAVSVNMYNYLYSDGSSITLLGKNGQTTAIFFAYQKISVEGTTIADNEFINGETVNVTIQMNEGNIDFVVNGEYTFSVAKPGFQLAQVSMMLATDRSSGSSVDRLNNIAISTSD